MNKSSRSRPIMVCALVACLVVFGGVLAGSLTPPGPPAPTMKTLDQVEARTPISSVPYTISQAGSYYLTGNLQGVSGQNGITVGTDNVTIDLNGFALIGVGVAGGSGSGILAATRNLIIRNGTIRDWPTYGIGAQFSLNVLIEDLVVTGSASTGVVVGSGMVRHVVTRSNEYGIFLYDSTGGTIEDCQAIENSKVGIFVNYNGLVTNNYSYANGGDGIYVKFSGSRVELNHSVGNVGYGINAPGTLNIFSRNSCVQNTGGNYNIGGVNDAGPIGTVATATSPWANISD